MYGVQRLFLCLTLLFLGAARLVAAQGTYTQIDVPGAVGTTLSYGINNSGDLVGAYEDTKGLIHGFLLSGGVYTSIDYPGALQGTQVFGLNGVGQIVGYTSSNPVVGFFIRFWKTNLHGDRLSWCNKYISCGDQ